MAAHARNGAMRRRRRDEQRRAGAELKALREEMRIHGSDSMRSAVTLFNGLGTAAVLMIVKSDRLRP